MRVKTQASGEKMDQYALKHLKDYKPAPRYNLYKGRYLFYIVNILSPVYKYFFNY